MFTTRTELSRKWSGLRLARLTASIAVGATGLALMSPGALAARGGGGGYPFSGCGNLVEGVECMLFQADSGGLYIVGGTSGHGVRFHVQGTVNPGCLSYCQQGNGCIFNAIITPCDEESNDAGPPQPFNVDDLISVLNTWGTCAAKSPCKSDLDRDGIVDARDLSTVIGGLR